MRSFTFAVKTMRRGELDFQTEQFVNDPEVDEMITRPVGRP